MFNPHSPQLSTPSPSSLADEDDTESDSDIDLLDVEASESSVCRTGSSVKSAEMLDCNKGPMEARTSRTSLDSSGVDSNFAKFKDEKKPVSETQQSPSVLPSSGTHPQTLGPSHSCHAFSKLWAQSPFHPRQLTVTPDAFSSMHMQHMLSVRPGLANEEDRGLHSESFSLPPFGYQLSPEVLEYQVFLRKHNLLLVLINKFDGRPLIYNADVT